MLTASDIELRAGAQLLLRGATFRVAAGDRIGLVGRNGAGKTTLMKTLAGWRSPDNGRISGAADFGYLPQDPRDGDLEEIARARILSARGLGDLAQRMRETEGQMASAVPETAEAAMERYPKLQARFEAAGGYAAESEAAAIASALGLSEKELTRPVGTLSGGQRRRVELSRILFSQAHTLLLDELTNHLDADSIVWLREYLRNYAGGLIVISHDVELLDAVVNKVYYLDANRQVLDQYNVGWKTYLQQRETDEKRRRRERQNAEKKAAALNAQAEKMRAKATKAVAAQQMLKRAEKIVSSLEEVQVHDKVAKLRFPDPVHCGKTPLRASGLSRAYGSQEVFTDVDLAIDKGSRVVVLGLNGAGKTTLLKILSGKDTPDTGQVEPGYGLRLGYYAQEHENLDGEATVLQNMVASAPDLTETECRKILGSFLFSGEAVDKPAGVLSGGEKTRLSLATLVVSGANVLLLDEPTNNLDPASREEILAALSNYKGAVVLVSHDAGAVEALNPERVLLLPDGVEDFWGPDYKDLIELA
ncbi:ABC-F family ATP-binding cassette domain-containing protein [Dermatophilus congolensis]|uniref:ABC-F family ATP-binding cassette domain-containing protein n=1 Tax=Dermatophilus congolensis TaxID=1863 RepID=UPI001AAF2E21|nr:ABC-F family ATP-binding cassette domain-containing protein [Dermatophilus congolensis]MBO3142881.1 ABC-F family ATP-binding cassette domain-containing protein [Dermatophilus congolensis]MBO3151872.1 ABC-F family ATP-binding cassette domain-containing protein [Dermatophilus congolensis]MBO3161123.1 ABC-F family ATP-binding cassette domain-containing protein [Dermatophilus congolensis]MBO3163155.1 ABC-F family ATP-binding cassette domain-containing protein [Dermatophilus congolensis]MBO31767